MNTLIIISMLLVAILALCSWVASRPRGRQFTPLANVGEGFQAAVQTMLCDAALATRYLLVKIGSDASHVAACGVGDIPVGFTLDTTDAAEDSVAVSKFGLQAEGAKGVASGAIAAGAMLVAGALGTVRTLPVAAGTYYIIGRATKAAADTDDVEFTPCFPIQRVVP
jgi:hypothetical protein